MTEKELHRLRRQDLLQLLLSQSKDVAQFKSRITELEETVSQLRESNDKLKGRLDEKDAQIEKLKGRLDEKDEEITELRESGRIELHSDGSAGVSLEEIFDKARQAAEDYLRALLREKQEAAMQEAKKTEVQKQEKAEEQTEQEETHPEDAIV